MRAKRTALLCLLVALTAGSADGAFAQKNSGRGPSPDVGRPMGGAGGLVPDEVVQLCQRFAGRGALQRRFGLARLESQTFQLSNSTLYRWRILDRRSVTSVVRALEGDRLVASAQPNYLFGMPSR
jgi:hypothetical protein